MTVYRTCRMLAVWAVMFSVFLLISGCMDYRYEKYKLISAAEVKTRLAEGDPLFFLAARSGEPCKHQLTNKIVSVAWPTEAPEDKEKLDDLQAAVSERDGVLVILCPRDREAAKSVYDSLADRGIDREYLYIMVEDETTGWPYEPRQ